MIQQLSLAFCHLSPRHDLLKIIPAQFKFPILVHRCRLSSLYRYGNICTMLPEELRSMKIPLRLLPL